MKNTFAFLVFIFAANISFAQLQFVSPCNGSKMVNPEHNIVIRQGEMLDANSLNEKLFSIDGSISGNHDFKMILARDEKTINLNPVTPFAFSEKVTVTISNGLRSADGKILGAYSFSFNTHREYSAEEKASFLQAKNILQKRELERNRISPDDNSKSPDNSDAFTIVKNTNPYPGEFFFDDWSSTLSSTPYDGINIIEANGDSVYYQKKSFCQDFDLNPNGYLSYLNGSSFDVLDSNYNSIDSYSPANGYSTDPHELCLNTDGNGWMVADDYEIVDMTVYNPNYCHNATVIGGVIQEFDPDHNLIFEWNGFDHIIITEAPHENLAFCYIDYMHLNSLDFDSNGNILFSCRHLDQVNLIDRNTGNFIWRLGGDSNQFVFVDDAEKFTYEHCARMLPNGHITLWDNGDYHSPKHSQAKEYSLDVAAKTATLVWHYQPLNYGGGSVYFYAMGSVQRLPNGGTLIGGGWDASSNQSNMWELDSLDNIVWELALTNAKPIVSYRVAKHNWNPCAPVNASTISVSKITDTSAKVSWGAVSNAASYDLQYRKLGNATWKLKNTTKTNKKLKNLKPGKSYEYQVRTNCLNGHTSDWSALDTLTTLQQRLLPAQITSAVNLHPNPANDELNIDFTLGEDETVTISFFDLAGKKMQQSNLQLAAGNQTLLFNLKLLPSGFYFVKVETPDETHTTKFLKQ